MFKESVIVVPRQLKSSSTEVTSLLEGLIEVKLNVRIARIPEVNDGITLAVSALIGASLPIDWRESRELREKERGVGTTLEPVVEPTAVEAFVSLFQS